MLHSQAVRNETRKSFTIIITIYGYYKWMFSILTEGRNEPSLKDGKATWNVN